MQDSYPISLVPVHQLEVLKQENGELTTGWRATGNDPQFVLDLGRPFLEAGWYIFSGNVEVLSGSIHSEALYPAYEADIHEQDRIDLDLGSVPGASRDFNVLVMFQDTVTSLRFDPSITLADFRINGVSLRRVGRLFAFQYMLRTLMARREGFSAMARLLARTAVDLVIGGPGKLARRLYSEYRQKPVVAECYSYQVWQDLYDFRDAADGSADALLAGLQGKPLVSVLVPTYNTAEMWLRRCIESVQRQAYPNWELCIADDASTNARVLEVLREYAANDSRIRVTFRKENGHISAASNSALELANGDFIALLDHDDELHPMALLECMLAFQRHPQWQMLYTDEDKIDVNGKRSDPYFKSAWNPDLFLSQNCICHLAVYRAAQLRKAGGFRLGFEGAQDWDLALRVAEKLRDDQIGHVAKVLYHWRTIAGSTATAASEKSYAHAAALRAVQESLDRAGNGAKVKETSGSGYFHIEHAVPTPAPLVSLLIPTRDRIDLLKQCIDSVLKKTDYPAYEIIIINNDSQEQRSKDYFIEVQRDPRIRVMEYPRPFNYSAINNAGAREARGSILGLLNNDIEVISTGWLHEMVGHALRPGTGVVGAMLYYPDDTIQHAGVILGVGGVAGHAYVGMPRGWPGDKSRARLAQNLSAVTAACAVFRREVFDEVGGLDEGLEVAFNDVDFCIRVREAGYRNVWTPFAELYHHESASRGYETTPEKVARFNREIDFMRRRWGINLERDPYYNANLTLDGTPFSLAFPPRRDE